VIIIIKRTFGADPAGSAPLFVKPDRGHTMLLSAWVTLRCCGVAYPGVGCPTGAFASPRHCVRRPLSLRSPPLVIVFAFPCRCVRRPLSLRSPPFVIVGHVARRWADHISVGCLTSAFASLRRRAVSNLGVGLPMSLWAALPRRLPPFH